MTLIVTDYNGCMDTVVDSVHVKPGIRFTFESDTVCYKGITHFTPVNEAPGDSLYAVNWNFGDPASGSSNNSSQYHATHVFTGSGTYIVTMQATNSDNCLDSTIREVRVNPLPVPAFTYQSQPCDTTIWFTDSTSAGGGTITSWEWDFGDGSPIQVIPAPGPGNISHKFATMGNYRVRLKVTNSFGCPDTVSMVVHRVPCMIPAFGILDNLLCAGYPVAFSDSSSPQASITRWQWKWGDGSDTTYTAPIPVLHHVFSSGGVYKVTLLITTQVDGVPVSDSTSRNVSIHPSPDVHFSNAPVCFNQVSLSEIHPILSGHRAFPGNGPLGNRVRQRMIHHPG